MILSLTHYNEIHYLIINHSLSFHYLSIDWNAFFVIDTWTDCTASNVTKKQSPVSGQFFNTGHSVYKKGWQRVDEIWVDKIIRNHVHRNVLYLSPLTNTEELFAY